MFKHLHNATKSGARAGVIHTNHGEIETPIFMPVGTVGSVKGILNEQLEEVGAQIILGNTYHLYLRPGLDILSEAGGLHKFMGWDQPILTDSGGYQVFSLAANRKLTREGAHFRSHIDGSKHLFTPENVVDMQRIIGSDIMMAFDECPPGDAPHDYVAKSLDLTNEWLSRCVERVQGTSPLYGYQQRLFPIVQGGSYLDLRKKSAEFALQTNSEGYAIGGLSVGEPAEVMYKVVGYLNDILPKDKPRYLMGVGTPANLLENIDRGIDMFDCVMPTRNGRNGMLFTLKGIINIKNKKWEKDFSPIDADSTLRIDRQHTKAYLRHLIISGEMLGAQIASLHNLAFYLRLMQQAREHILNDTFSTWKKEMSPILSKRL